MAEDIIIRWNIHFGDGDRKFLKLRVYIFKSLSFLWGAGGYLELLKVQSVRREVLDQDEELGYRLINGGV